MYLQYGVLDLILTRPKFAVWFQLKNIMLLQLCVTIPSGTEELEMHGAGPNF